MAISGISSLAGIGETTTSRTSIANNFDTFLQLLTTQLQNQNPLDPLDSNEFTQQLVQFTEVEQSLKTNEQLATLLSFQSASIASSAVNYIGTTISAEGTTADLANGSAEWTYDLPVPAPNSQITVRNEAGLMVYSASVSLQEGQHKYSWSGQTTDGSVAPDGLYNITIDARDANDNHISVKTSVTGRVDGVDLSEAEPVLLIGSKRIKLSTITRINS